MQAANPRKNEAGASERTAIVSSGAFVRKNPKKLSKIFEGKHRGILEQHTICVYVPKIIQILTATESLRHKCSISGRG